MREQNISLKYGLQKVGLPLIVTSNSPHLCFLIDTGATHNILFSFVYNELPTQFEPLSTSSTIAGIDGEKQFALQVKGTLEFEGKTSIATFSVIEASKVISQVQQENGVQIHGILGIPFLTENKWILDFNELKIGM